MFVGNFKIRVLDENNPGKTREVKPEEQQDIIYQMKLVSECPEISEDEE